MDEEPYTAADCAETVDSAPLTGKVVAVKPENLPGHHPGQLFLCTGEAATNPPMINKLILTVSLDNGESYRWERRELIGALKPERLPNHARLMLSQIKPCLDRLKQEGEHYTGYCFLPNGRYSSGVRLVGSAEALTYAETQAPYQSRILICDHNDYGVLEYRDGTLVYPTPEEQKAFGQRQE
jgi:hypothetical protein